MQLKFIPRLGLSFLLLITFSCKEEQKSIVSPIDLSFKTEGKLDMYAATTKNLIASFDIEFAEDSYEIQTGLMNRNSLENNQAMLFVFPDVKMRSFYMKNTLISLDIIYIDASKKVISIQRNTRPMDETSLSSEAPAKYVLEINGGLSDKLQIIKGDSISFNKY